jgi:hypothetical protein
MTPVLAVTAAVAMALVVFRAATQAITIDEATTYVLFVQNDMPFHWLGSTNNHVVNTALMRLTTRLFGVSELSARLPALLGAAIYITACYRFCRRVGSGWILQWVTLVCLIFSPFIMDYLVAARGYGLALGFLMTALLADPKTLSGCILASTMLGLCFASNFSFAFVCAAVGVLQIRKAKSMVAYVVPAIIVMWVIELPSLMSFPRAELTYGAHSLGEALLSVLKPQAGIASPWALALPGVLLLPSLRRSLYSDIFLLTIALHVVAFYALGLLYPLDRTGIFLIPLAIAAAATTSAPGKGTTTALLGIGLLSIASLRLDHFEEWPFDADTDKVYAVTSCLQVHRVAAGWPHAAALNFYRQKSASTLDPVVGDANATQETEAFVIDARLNPTVISDYHLTAIWKSTRTNATIAVPISQADRFQGSMCLE